MADLGYEVCGIATSDSRARSLAMEDQPDIVLMDVLSGGREGIETSRVRRIHERVPGAPVVSKPFYRDRLAEAIATAVPHVGLAAVTEPSRMVS